MKGSCTENAVNQITSNELRLVRTVRMQNQGTQAKGRWFCIIFSRPLLKRVAELGRRLSGVVFFTKTFRVRFRCLCVEIPQKLHQAQVDTSSSFRLLKGTTSDSVTLQQPKPQRNRSPPGYLVRQRLLTPRSNSSCVALFPSPLEVGSGTRPPGSRSWRSARSLLARRRRSRKMAWLRALARGFGPLVLQEAAHILD